MGHTHCHSVLCECACFIRAYDWCTSQSLYSIEFSYKTVFHLSLLCSECQADLQNSDYDNEGTGCTSIHVQDHFLTHGCLTFLKLSNRKDVCYWTMYCGRCFRKGYSSKKAQCVRICILRNDLIYFTTPTLISNDCAARGIIYSYAGSSIIHIARNRFIPIWAILKSSNGT